MADDTNIPNEITVTRIDAPFPEQWREEMFQFVNELKGIKDGLNVLHVDNVEAVQANKKMADFYSAGGKSPAASVAQYEAASGPILNRFGVPFSSDPATVQAALGQQAKKDDVTPPTPSLPPDAPEEDEQSKTFAQKYLEKMGPLEMPQYYGGVYTTQDLLKGGAQVSNWLAGKAGDNSSLTSPLNFAANSFARLGQAMPPLSMLKQYGSQAMGYSSGLESYAGALGQTPVQSGGLGVNDISVLGMNFRPPLINPTALAGASQYLNTFGQSLNYPGMSTGEAAGINQGLAERGWYPGSMQTQGMFDALGQMTSWGGAYQQMAMDPAVQDLQDKATRVGTTSMQDWLETMKQVPDAAKNANEGINQMLADMNSFGDFSESQGGTHFAGQQQALGFANTTGLPSAIGLAMAQSPWNQSAIFRATGQPQWMQGILPGSVKNQYMMQGFWQAAQAVGRPQAISESSPAGGNFAVSGIAQQAAMMHQFMMPDVPIEQIQRMLKEGPGGIKRRMGVDRSIQAWQQTAQNMLQTGHTGNQFKDFISGSLDQGNNFDHILKYMARLKTDSGAHMFSPEDIKKIRTNSGQGYDTLGAARIRDQYNAVEKILGEKSNKVNNNTGSPDQQLTIDLSPAAKKFLQLPNKKSQMKLAANGGSGQNINGAYTGYTDGIQPAMRPSIEAAQSGYYGGGR